MLILSGKGGTGKTTVAGAFIKLAEAKAYADCDVDAPNLHLLTGKFDLEAKSHFFGQAKSEINQKLCTKCDECVQHCRFDAIQTGEFYTVNHFSCEGCGVCEFICPNEAAGLRSAITGELLLKSNGRNDVVFSTAKLKMGNGSSGKLVSEVKKRLKEATSRNNVAIIDGSPGIGCPVLASLSGADMLLIVTEPSLSGVSDMERLLKTAFRFQIDMSVCINKFDTNPEITNRIVAYCESNHLHLAGKIPFDPSAVKAINSGRSIVEIDCPSGRAVNEIYENAMKYFFRNNSGLTCL